MKTEKSSIIYIYLLHKLTVDETPTSAVVVVAEEKSTHGYPVTSICGVTYGIFGVTRGGQLRRGHPELCVVYTCSHQCR